MHSKKIVCKMKQMGSERGKKSNTVSFTPNVTTSKVESNFSVCLHVLDWSMWTCFALNKTHALFKDVETCQNIYIDLFFLCQMHKTSQISNEWCEK